MGIPIFDKLYVITYSMMEVSPINLRYLEYFTEIARCGSINKAAQKLNLSQPNLSANIKQLEEELGFQVFFRKSSGIELTSEGTLLLQSAEVILREMRRIYRIPEGFSKSNNLSIACTNSSFLMKSFIDFKKKHPGNASQDSFKETGQIQAVLDVAERRYRMAIIYCFSSRAKEQKQRAMQYNLNAELLAKGIPVVGTVGKDGPLAKKEYIQYEDLQRYPLVAFENFDYEDWLGPLGINDISNVLHVFDRGGMIDTLKNSSYIAVMMAGSPPQGVVDLPIKGFDERLELYLMYPRGSQLNQREKQFVGYMKKALKRLMESLVDVS